MPLPSRNLRFIRLATWLGLFALALNALVPIHLAFDLAESIQLPHRVEAASHDAEWRFLALLTGHHLGDDHAGASRHGKDHDAPCPVCSAIGSLAGPPPVALPALVIVFVASTISLVPIAATIRSAAFVAAYRSRAPPLNSAVR